MLGLARMLKAVGGGGLGELVKFRRREGGEGNPIRGEIWGGHRPGPLNDMK